MLYTSMYIINMFQGILHNLGQAFLRAILFIHVGLRLSLFPNVESHFLVGVTYFARDLVTERFH